MLGNALSALAPTYATLVAARFVAGLPHGGFFGLASLVAVAMAPRGQGGRAVGTVMLGIPIAMVAGVPLGTWVGQELGWRSAYWAVAVIAAAALLASGSIPLLLEGVLPAVRRTDLVAASMGVSRERRAGARLFERVGRHLPVTMAYAAWTAISLILWWWGHDRGGAFITILLFGWYTLSLLTWRGLRRRRIW